MLSACGNSNTQNENGNDSANNNKNEDTIELGQEELSLPYVSWASTVASVNVVKAVLEDVGYEINAQQVEAGACFQGLPVDLGIFSRCCDTAKYTC